MHAPVEPAGAAALRCRDRIQPEPGGGVGGLVAASARRQPARTLRQAGQQDQEQRRRHRRDAQFPAPRDIGGDRLRDQIVAEIGDQDAGDDVELEQADQPEISIPVAAYVVPAATP